MIIQSVIIGVVLGWLWGNDLSRKYSKVNRNNCSSSWFLASTSTIRYLLLAAILILMIKKNFISISWWAAGFFISFWVTLLVKNRRLFKE